MSRKFAMAVATVVTDVEWHSCTPVLPISALVARVVAGLRGIGVLPKLLPWRNSLFLHSPAGVTS